ncbi:uncharacterized protein LOC121376831 isoform X2 [Gigantopelta aegis]|uniref:uncharacterized protein LOC121376831 isoform X2 n=1 Tax=Gigantopelta aegis TaxID=1735272 RepID=UPI001B88E175|nr:uncharacterized protein LOC121376831 isoform X2 [Gigantopelta aegis]
MFLDDILSSVTVKSPFMLYGGGLFGVIYLVSVVIIISLRRRSPVVVPLTTPPIGEICFEYIVSIQTSLKPNSGLSSTARVYIQLLGEFHDSSSFLLKKNKVTQDILHRGALDIFVIHTRYDLGNILGISLKVYSSLPKDIWRPVIVSVWKSSCSDCWISWSPEMLVCNHNLQMTIPLEFYKLGTKRRGDAVGQYFVFLGVKHLLISHLLTSTRFGVVSSPVCLLLFYFSLAGIFTSTLIIYGMSQDVQADAKKSDFAIEDTEWRTIHIGMSISILLSWMMELVVKNIKPINMDKDFEFCGLQELKLYRYTKEKEKNPEEHEDNNDYDDEDDDYDDYDDYDHDGGKYMATSGRIKPVGVSEGHGGSLASVAVDISRLPLKEFTTHMISDVHASLLLSAEGGKGTEEFVDEVDQWHHFLQQRLLKEMKHILKSEADGGGNEEWQTGKQVVCKSEVDGGINEERRTGERVVCLVVCKDCSCLFCQQVHMTIRRDCCFLLDMLMKAVLRSCHDCLVRKKTNSAKNKSISRVVDAVKTVSTYIIEQLQYTSGLDSIDLDLMNIPLKKTSSRDSWKRQQQKGRGRKNSESLAHIFVKGIVGLAVDELQKVMNIEMTSLPPQELAAHNNANIDTFLVDLIDDLYTHLSVFLYQQVQHKLDIGGLATMVENWLQAFEQKISNAVNSRFLPTANAAGEILPEAFYSLRVNTSAMVSEIVTNDYLENFQLCGCHGRDRACAGLSLSKEQSGRFVVLSKSDMSLERTASRNDIIRHTMTSDNCGCMHCKQLRRRVRRDCTFVLAVIVKAVLRCCYECLVEYNKKNAGNYWKVKDIVNAVETICSNIIEQFQSEDSYREITPTSNCCEAGVKKAAAGANFNTVAHIFLSGVITVSVCKLQRDLVEELELLSPLAPCLVCDADDFIGSTGNFAENYIAHMYTMLTQYLYTHYRETFDLQAAVKMCKQWLDGLQKEVLRQVTENLSTKGQKMSVKGQNLSVKGEKAPKSDDVTSKGPKLAFTRGKEPYSYSDMIRHVIQTEGCNCFYCQQINRKLFMNCIPVLERTIKDCQSCVQQVNFNDQFQSIWNKDVDSMHTICAHIIQWIKDPDQHTDVVSDAKYKAFKGWDSSKAIVGIPNRVKPVQNFEESTIPVAGLARKKRPVNATLDENVAWLVNDVIEASEFEISYDVVETSQVRELCGEATEQALGETWDFYQTPPYTFTAFLIQQKAICRLTALARLAKPDVHIPTVVRQNFSYALFAETEHHFAGPDTLASEAWLNRLLEELGLVNRFVTTVKTVITYRSIVNHIARFINYETAHVVAACIDQACRMLAGPQRLPPNQLAVSILRGGGSTNYAAHVTELKEVVIQTQVECDQATQACFSRIKRGIAEIIEESLAEFASSEEDEGGQSDSIDKYSLSYSLASEQTLMFDIKDLSKDLQPLTNYMQHTQTQLAKTDIENLEKQLQKITRNHRDCMAVNVQNIVDSYYVMNEVPIGYTEEELYIAEWAMTKTLKKRLPVKLKWFVLFLLFATTSTMICFFVLKGAALTTPQAKEWVCLAVINVAIYGLVFEPLKVLIMNVYRDTWPYY